jgi:hypothetical protein
LTIFIIIALVIAAGITTFFVVRSSLQIGGISGEFQPVYDYFLTCIENSANDGTRIMGEQAGYIESPDFQAGSSYAPFSNQFSFMSTGIPYWYYVSGNGVIKEQIPSKKTMEQQLGSYIIDNLDCDFTQFKNQGFEISLEASKASASISSNEISVNLNANLVISKGDKKARQSSHKININNNFGSLYENALKIYNKENKEMFLENYAVDALNLYAPVSGTEISCSPLIWSPYQIFENLSSALSANIQAINKKPGYFSIDAGVDKNLKTNFIYDNNVKRFEVWPTKGKMMIAEPVGTQPGLGAIGFCYTPYKFVYDLYFPVLIQVYDENSLFQFPVAVVINKNIPREAMPGDYIENKESICNKANTEIIVNAYNNNLESIEADIKLKCLNDECSLGSTKSDNLTSGLKAMAPQCANAVLVASAEGYKETEYTISTNEESSADIIMNREYDLNLEVYVDNQLTNDMSVLSVSENGNFLKSVSYPSTKEIKLGEGNYEFELKVYRQSSINIPAVNKKQCVQVPKSGIVGLFGGSNEKCFDYTIPAQTVTNVISAGGYANQYVTENEFGKAKKIKIYASSIKIPSNVEQIPEVYDAVDKNKLSLILE